MKKATTTFFSSSGLLSGGIIEMLYMYRTRPIYFLPLILNSPR